jgi:hypothetical protein
MGDGAQLDGVIAMLLHRDNPYGSGVEASGQRNGRINE